MPSPKTAIRTLGKFVAGTVIISCAASTSVMADAPPGEYSPSTGTNTAQTAKECLRCGVVESVKVVNAKGHGSGAGAVAGGVAGAVIGGGLGRGRTFAEVLGAAAGAHMGNEMEKDANNSIRYKITVRMNDGTMRTIKQRAWRSATNGRGAWWNAGASHMNVAFPKSYFDRLGLVSLVDS